MSSSRGVFEACAMSDPLGIERATRTIRTRSRSLRDSLCRAPPTRGGRGSPVPVIRKLEAVGANQQPGESLPGRASHRREPRCCAFSMQLTEVKPPLFRRSFGNHAKGACDRACYRTPTHELRPAHTRLVLWASSQRPPGVPHAWSLCEGVSNRVSSDRFLPADEKQSVRPVCRPHHCSETASRSQSSASASLPDLTRLEPSR